MATPLFRSVFSFQRFLERLILCFEKASLWVLGCFWNYFIHHVFVLLYYDRNINIRINSFWGTVLFFIM